jgi:hypothetical protein
MAIFTTLNPAVPVFRKENVRRRLFLSFKIIVYGPGRYEAIFFAFSGETEAYCFISALSFKNTWRGLS